MLHVWYIYPQNWVIYKANVDKYKALQIEAPQFIKEKPYDHFQPTLTILKVSNLDVPGHEAWDIPLLKGFQFQGTW